MRQERPPQDDATIERARSGVRPAERRAAGVARLTLVHPPGLQERFDLGEASWTIGRQARGSEGLVIVAPTISRAHVELRFDAASGRHWARDLGSRNGTWLEGQVLGALPRPLDSGAVLRIGDVLAIYEAGRASIDPVEVDRAAIPGVALAIEALRAAALRAARQRGAALVIGETGAGKERIAAELHRLSGRRGELVVANCAALSATLIESQLFGHDRGAFTGATQRSSGLFRAAEGGTLVLDEIGELPADLQPKLLRAIEYGEVMPVGSSRAQVVDVRVIGVTNRDLALEVEAGRFRRDLYARLALAELRVPPLRERRVDLLAWLDRVGGASLVAGLSAGAAEAILLHRWPENLRGLHRLARDLELLTGPIPAQELPEWLRCGPTPGGALRAVTAAATSAGAEDEEEGAGPAAGPRVNRPRPPREELLRVLEERGWSIRATARYYERDRKQISRWIEHYSITLPNR
jgi:transcriptional regulator with GAF, ATPase, and Fis domain